VTFSQWLKLKKTWTLIILLFIAFTFAALATAAFFFKEKIIANSQEPDNQGTNCCFHPNRNSQKCKA
jgi:hypothetical protein